MRNKAVKILVLLHLFLLRAAFVQGNVPTTFRTISTENGLSSNRINTIFKDQRGFVWLGTQMGVNRFDGNEVRFMPALGSDEVFCLAETDEKWLWVGSESGLRKFDRTTHQAHDVPPGIANTVVRDIAVADTALLLATNKGLMIVGSQTLEHVVFENGVSSANRLTAICTADSVNYWCASQAGLCRYNLKERTTDVFRYNNGQINLDNYTSIVCVDSVIYAGSYNRGVICFDIRNSEFAILPEFQDMYVLAIEHHEGKLYIGTNGYGLKIYSLRDRSVQTIAHEVNAPYSIESNAVYSVLRDGNIYWIGTYNGGLSYNPNTNAYFRTFRTADFNSLDYNVRSFALAENGDKLIGTRNGLVFLSPSRGIFRKYTHSDNTILHSDIILYIAPYKEHKYLVGTYGCGMYVYDTRRLAFSRFLENDVFLSGCIFRFSKDKQGIWWIATDRGLFEYDEQNHTLNQYTTTNSHLPHNNILYLYEDSQERIWLGTEGGLCIFDKSSKMIHANDALANYPELKVIINVSEDSEGNIWVASHRAFAKMNPALSEPEIISFNQENVGVMSITEDTDKKLWLATTQGIIRYDILDKSYQTYNIGDGIMSYNFANVAQMTSPDDIWWANEKGLLHCHIPDLAAPRSSQQPVITAINFTPRSKSDTLSNAPEFAPSVVLSNDQNDIRFRFSLLSYSLPQANIYEYMLEGYDAEWKRQIGSPEAAYYRLPAGKYVFRVRDANNNAQETALNITVRKDLRKLVSAALFVLLMVVFALLAYKFRTLAMRKLKATFVQEKYAHSRLETADLRKIAKQLESYMETERPYLKQDLKQSDVAKKLRISSGELSQALNQYLDTNFSDFVNKYRIEEFIEKMKDKSSAKYTLTALGEQCGFSSRSSFFRAIKKHTGLTPVELLKKVDPNHKNRPEAG